MFIKSFSLNCLKTFRKQWIKYVKGKGFVFAKLVGFCAEWVNSKPAWTPGDYCVLTGLGQDYWNSPEYRRTLICLDK